MELINDKVGTGLEWNHEAYWKIFRNIEHNVELQAKRKVSSNFRNKVVVRVDHNVYYKVNDKIEELL